MANVKKESKTYDLKVEKQIKKPAAEVFRAIGEGRLFLNCGADNKSLKIDFKVGGKYSIEFLAFDVSNCGEFLEIIPNEKIVFTWCQNFKVSSTPDTVVTIDLKEKNAQTMLTITHTGFTTQEGLDDHTGGWNGGLTDLGTEMEKGQLKFNRLCKMPVQKLFETWSERIKNGSIKGKVLETVPGEKIIFSPDKGEGKVTLSFESEEGDQSWIELLHEGLASSAQIKSHRATWDELLKS